VVSRDRVRMGSRAEPSGFWDVKGPNRSFGP